MAKINVQVDMSDFFNEEGEEISLNDLMMDAIKCKVRDSMRELVTNEVRSTMKAFFKDELESEIRAEMKVFLRDFMTTKELPESYGNLTVEEYLLDKFNNSIHSSSILSEIRDLAKKWGEATKAQYDGVFATKVVESLNQMGLLIPSAAQFLLDKKTGE